MCKRRKTMDIEKMLIEGVNVSISCAPDHCLNIGSVAKLPMCESEKDIFDRMPKHAKETQFFNARRDDVNAYMKSRFRLDMGDFMHVATSNMIMGGFAIDFQLPCITCVWRREDCITNLQLQMAEHQRLLVDCPFSLQGTFPNLHDISVYILTLIECDFALSSEYANMLRGTYYVGQEYRFVIKLSPQLDLTIMYSKK